MKFTIKATIAVACAFGMTTAFAQNVQRGDTAAVKGTQTVAQASTAAPVQVAQAGAAAGGAAGGASTGGVVAGVGAAGTVGSTVVFVGSAAAAAAASSSGTYTPTAH
jgi:hypothetical protein